MRTDKILVIGAGGQIGSELTLELRKIYGNANVVASDIQLPKNAELAESGPFETLNILDFDNFKNILKKYQINQVYHLAAILSATGEKNPKFAWELNMEGLIVALDAAKEGVLNKVYWPSSIAVFGPNTPSQNTPQFAVMDPNTIYGISKLAGERWCEYYFKKYNVDIRSIRYPGLIGYKSMPGGGTTDYAVDIYHKALAGAKYECFLSENTYLPMMYMPDAIRATLELMHTDSANVKIRSSYNLAGISFSPKEIANAIKLQIPDFEISYNPDFRQQIADSWPKSIDDSYAQKDWGWKMEYDLQKMTADMLLNLKK
jgi:nucleoside-diphosphate-sugar epimerase